MPSNAMRCIAFCSAAIRLTFSRLGAGLSDEAALDDLQTPFEQGFGHDEEGFLRVFLGTNA